MMEELSEEKVDDQKINNHKNAKISKYIGIGLSVGLFVVLLWRFSFICWYIIIAAVISFIGAPLVSFFKKRKIWKRKYISSGFAAVLTIVIIIVCICLLLVTLVPLIIQQAEIISNIDIKSIGESLNEPINNVTLFLRKIGVLDNESTFITIVENKLVSIVNGSFLGNALTSIINSMGNFFVAFFSIFFISFYFLKDDMLFNKIIMLFVRDEQAVKVSIAIRHVKRFLSRYFIGLLAEVLGMFVLESIGLSIVGVKGALPIAMMGALFNIIPYIGPIIGTTLAVIVGSTSMLSLGLYDQLLWHAIFIIIVFVVSNWIDNFFLQPYIYSRSMQLHPLEVFLVILIFGSFGGVLGMLLAIPGYTVLKVIAKEFFSDFEILDKWTRGLKIEDSK